LRVQGFKDSRGQRVGAIPCGCPVGAGITLPLLKGRRTKYLYERVILRVKDYSIEDKD
jgi:hypothetical protein